ncbi:MAG: sigma-70 family RNA polymerase sigma factor, partial [Verrucomicrobiaceae bacterium]
ADFFSNRPLAEEISQNVLCALAAKAGSLARNPERLPAWLHRATLYESTKAMRSETSRRRREELADLHGETSQGAALADALPHLDPALDRLGEADRRLLLLHYYEGRSFPDIAGLLGKSTVAVQKQSQRALEKLARMLRGKGVALSLAGLATVLSGEFAKAASPSLTSSVVAAVIAKSGGTSTGLTLFMVMKSKALVPAALLIAVIPLVLMEVAISRAEQRNESLRFHSTTSVAAVRPAVASAQRGSDISSSIDIMVLINEQYRARRGGHQMWSEFLAKLVALDRETLRRLTRETVVCRIYSRSKGELLDCLVDAMTEVDPEFAVKTAVEALDPAASNPVLWGYADVPTAFGNWAWKDPEAAWAWVKEQEQTGILRPIRVGPTQVSAEELKAQLLWTLMVRKHPMSEALIQGIGETGGGIPNVLDRSLRLDPSPGIDPGAGDHAWVGACLDVMREQVPEGDRESLYQAMVWRFRPVQPGSLENLSALFRGTAITAEERVALVREVIAARSNMKFFPAEVELDRRFKEETRAWLNSVLTEDEATDLLGKVSQEIRERKRHETHLYLGVIGGDSTKSDESLAKQLCEEDFGEWAGEAIEVAEKIKDPDLRDQTILHLRKQLNPKPTEE